MAKPILIIHPKDNTTRFLNRIKNHLINNFQSTVHHFNIQYSELSHNQCLSSIKVLSKGSTVIFLGHGRSNSLYGSKAPYYDNSLVSSEAMLESPNKFFGKETFIDINNIDVFRDLNVFCLACNSNAQIAKSAISKGTICYIGFGDIPTSTEELDKSIKQHNVSLNKIISNIKTEINYIIKKSLEISIRNNNDFEQLFHLIRFISNQRISFILTQKKFLKERYIIADYIYFFKNEMKIYGDIKSKII